ncbi:MAG: outer membrane beta-barrel protein [Pseudomonadales bacterium]
MNHRVCNPSIFLLAFLLTHFVQAEPLQLVVQEVYIDLHPGPGRGFPRQYAVERGATINVIKQRTDWIKVRTERGNSGWAKSSDLEKTLTTAGLPVRLSRTRFSDYRQQRFEMSAGGGYYAAEPEVFGRFGYRWSKIFSVELGVTQVTSDFSSSTLIMANVLAQPFQWGRFSPFLSAGVGRNYNDPNRSLIDSEKTDSDFYNFGLGTRFYLTRSLVVRAEYKRYNLLEGDENDGQNEYNIGLSFFF